jgi:endonuclease/exonuclease/phosphatase family metal-dependent hydrolase
MTNHFYCHSLYNNNNMPKVATYNVNYSRRATEPFYGAFMWKNRKEHVYNLIKEINADVWFIQELLGDQVEEFRNHFSDYLWYFEPQKSRGGVTSIGIGLKKSFLVSKKEVEFLEYDFRRKIDGAQNVVGALVDDTMFWSVHMPMSGEIQAKMISKFAKHIDGIPAAERLVLGGDFNSFPDGYGFTAIPRINAACRTYTGTECAVNESDGLLAVKTFYSYPFDPIPKSAQKSIGKLDHIFVRGYEASGATVWDRCIEKTTFRPSDHLPLSVNLQPV